MFFKLDKTNKNFIECLYGNIKVKSIDEIFGSWKDNSNFSTMGK